jgi:hypothetical protein
MCFFSDEVGVRFQLPLCFVCVAFSCLALVLRAHVVNGCCSFLLYATYEERVRSINALVYASLR